MKKLLCYLGILLLLLLVLFPPMLRLVLKDKEEEQKQEVTKTQLLFCQGDKYLSTTNYSGDKITMIMIKKNNESDKETENEDNNEIEETDNSEFTEFDTVFDNLKNEENVLYKEQENGELLTIDFSVTTYSNLKIDYLKQKIDDQKKYYEDFGLICNIKE